MYIYIYIHLKEITRNNLKNTQHGKHEQNKLLDLKQIESHKTRNKIKEGSVSVTISVTMRQANGRHLRVMINRNH
uniref:Uncharacterized protein n=1 Tax=Rhizophora mucronata TaxID=61149 RepID=A0A2P2PQY2_RHIMU